MNYIIKYGKRQLFKRGISVSISLLYKCNLSCSYCSLKNFGTKKPKETVIHRPTDWIKYIETFPVKIKEVLLTGGEPALYGGIDYLTNELLKRGYFVTIYTNLVDITHFIGIKQSPNLKFQATYHKGVNINLFDINYQRMNNKYRIDVDEIETDYFIYSNKKKLCTLENESVTNRLRIDSDMKIYTNCNQRNQAHL